MKGSTQGGGDGEQKGLPDLLSQNSRNEVEKMWTSLPKRSGLKLVSYRHTWDTCTHTMNLEYGCQ